MQRPLLFFAVFACALTASVAVAEIPAVETPKPLPQPAWLDDHMRFGFVNQMDEKAIDMALHDGLNMVAGGTNAGGVGFAGGPWSWDEKSDRFYYMLKGPWVEDGKGECEYADFAPIRARVDKAHAKGLKVIGELMTMWEPQQMVEHPDWQMLPSADSKPGKPGADWGKQIFGCYNSPFGDFYIRKNVSLIKKLDWDGQNLDGFGQGIMCYCQYCREGYKQASDGAALPPKLDINDANCRRYMRWRIDTYNVFVDKWMRGLKGAKADFVFIPWSSAPQRWIVWEFLPQLQGNDYANRLVDAPAFELLFDFAGGNGGNLVPSFNVRLYRGICGERRFWPLAYFRSHAQQLAVTPPPESDFRIFTILANGGTPPIPYWGLDTETTTSHYVKLIADREPWLKQARSQKWAAMLVSESSRLFYGISARRGQLGGQLMNSGVDTKDESTLPFEWRRMPAHMESSLGVFRAALEAHLPLDIVTDVDMDSSETLAQYKVLILPNAACISDKGLASIRAFVAAGGGLVAMHESSRFDSLGNERPDLGLKDLFNVSFKGLENHAGAPEKYDNPCYLRFADHEITNDKAVRAECDRVYYQYYGMDYIGVTANTEVQGKPAVAIERRNIDPKLWPFLVLSEPEKGRVAYFAADIGQAYFTAAYNYERPLIANTLRWAARQAPAVSVTAPKCVQATFYEQAAEKRTVVHLLNEILTQGNRALPSGDPPVRDEIVPIADIKVLFRDASIKRVCEQPGGRELAMKKTAEGVEVTLPKLEMYSLIVAER